MEEYLTTLELSTRIKITPGAIRNLVYENKFQKNIHYVKPTSRKLLFVWSKIEAWLYEDPVKTDNESKNKLKSLINI